MVYSKNGRARNQYPQNPNHILVPEVCLLARREALGTRLRKPQGAVRQLSVTFLLCYPLRDWELSWERLPSRTRSITVSFFSGWGGGGEWFRRRWEIEAFCESWTCYQSFLRRRSQIWHWYKEPHKGHTNCWLHMTFRYRDGELF